LLSNYPTNGTEILDLMKANLFISTFLFIAAVTIVIPSLLRVLRGRPKDPMKGHNSGVFGWLFLSLYVAVIVTDIPFGPEYYRPELYVGCCFGILLPVAWIASNYPSAVELREAWGIEFKDIFFNEEE
jgi:hypothetical protein|tara:strand:+ start:106 stop:489 length:384 start_codon:yes stop_codon:yes gene_type:complete